MLDPDVLAAHTARMRVASGKVDDERSLVGFLYILARDHLTPGTIESIMVDHQIAEKPGGQFTNGWLATWAQDLAERLCPPTRS